MSSVSLEVNSGKDQAGYNNITGYGKFEAQVPSALPSSFIPDVPSIDPMVQWRMKQRDNLKDELKVKDCDGLNVSERDYRVAATQANQKGRKATKSGAHGTKTEFYQTSMIEKRSPDPDVEPTKDEKPPQEVMNAEYNRYKYGNRLYPPAFGTQLDGAKPVLLTGNQIVYQPPVAMGAGQGGRRYGREADKYALPIVP